ncbi:ankyrin repeat-containing domain protein [Baffinella frigidus]|nr:ankyrin repeat-containing domain protein [Cryptophyta sp. CCMP2293]
MKRDAVARMLLDNGARVNMKTEKGTTPLHYATWQGSEANVLMLLERGADINAATNTGSTPLLRAAWVGADSMVKSLLDNGADVQIKGEFGYSPLHCAVRRGDVSLVVVQMLLDKGADVHARSSSGQTPEDLASGPRKAEVAVALHAAMLKAKCAAFVWGQHERLGAASLVLALEPELVRMIYHTALEV